MASGETLVLFYVSTQDDFVTGRCFNLLHNRETSMCLHQRYSRFYQKSICYGYLGNGDSV